MNVINYCIKNPLHVCGGLFLAFLFHRFVQYCMGKPKAKDALNDIQNGRTDVLRPEAAKPLLNRKVETSAEIRPEIVTAPVLEQPESKIEISIEDRIKAMRESACLLRSGKTTVDKSLSILMSFFDQLSDENQEISIWAEIFISAALMHRMEPKIVQAVLGKCTEILSMTTSIGWEAVEGLELTDKSKLQTFALRCLSSIVCFSKVEDPEKLNILLIDLIKMFDNATQQGCRSILEIFERLYMREDKNLYPETIEKSVFLFKSILTRKHTSSHTLQANAITHLNAALNPKVPAVEIIPASDRHPAGWDAFTIVSTIYENSYYSGFVSDYKKDAADACKNYLDRAKAERTGDGLTVLYNLIDRWALTI